MATLSHSELQYIIAGLAHPTTPTRADGRTLLQPRAVGVSYGDAPAANGSARVRIGGTDVVAGIKLEVADVAEGSRPRTKVDVDVTPQAFPGGTSSSLQNLSSSYAAFVTDHFLPSVPVLRITDKKAFVPTLHLTVLGADGSVPMALVLAARAAFCDLAVPKTKVIGWEGAEDDARAGKDMAGIKGAVGAARGKGRARARGADDWDLEDGSTEHMANRDTLPVLVTLHLVPESDAFFVDAAPKEEEACSGKIHAMFRPDGRICGLRTEGDAGIDASRIRPLLQEAKAIALDLAASLNTDLP